MYFCFREGFLDYKIIKNGFMPTAKQLELIKNFKYPNTTNQLRHMLGILNFYRRFNKNANKNMAPLNNLLKRSTKDRIPIR